MFHIRVVKTASGAQAVQVVYYRDRKRNVFKHVGSAKTKEGLESLKLAAQDLIDHYIPPLPLTEPVKSDNVLVLNKTEFLGVYYSFLYEVLSALHSQIGFGKIKERLLLDLVIMRIMEPASKLRSIELLQDYFGIGHQRQNYYRSACKWMGLKPVIEASSVDFATRHYGFNFDLLFYDVTTLYFETFDEDELRKTGFSKDNKSQQPQILVALMVTKEGLPIAYEIFPGNTFEGNTIIPVVKKFTEKYAVQEFTVVADAAMISMANIEQLMQNSIHFIVGARLANLSSSLIDQIDKSIGREDGNSIRIKTDNGALICNYSISRYRKDKYEMEKQIEKARIIIQHPSKNRKPKFTKSDGAIMQLNEALIVKTTKLLGIKGYYTDLKDSVASNQTVIDRYHELYRIEQAFRMSKSDLQTRPIFHYKEEPIKVHLLICFMALVVSKHIELRTGVSIKRFITESKKITDARLLNKITGKEIKIRTQLSPQILQILKSLNLPH